MNKNNETELKVALERRHHKIVGKVIARSLNENDASILPILEKTIINHNEMENGIILNEVTKGYFRLKKKFTNDCSPLFELLHIKDITVQESLLEVLGYDKMIPSYEEQRTIIAHFFNYGQDIDRRYYSDPRYGLAAACAGWNKEIVNDFLIHCVAIGDAPLKYVAENSLQGKYVKLR